MVGAIEKSQHHLMKSQAQSESDVLALLNRCGLNTLLFLFPATTEGGREMRDTALVERPNEVLVAATHRPFHTLERHHHRLQHGVVDQQRDAGDRDAHEHRLGVGTSDAREGRHVERIQLMHQMSTRSGGQRVEEQVVDV